MKEMSQLTKKGVSPTNRHDWSLSSGDAHLIACCASLCSPTLKSCFVACWSSFLFETVFYIIAQGDSQLYSLPASFILVSFHSHVCAWSHVCGACAWMFAQKLVPEIILDFSYTFIHWARVSQSNSELGSMTVLPNQLALGIPCLLFPGLELQTATTPTWRIVWVLGIWTQVLTWL